MEMEMERRTVMRRDRRERGWWSERATVVVGTWREQQSCWPERDQHKRNTIDNAHKQALRISSLSLLALLLFCSPLVVLLSSRSTFRLFSILSIAGSFRFGTDHETPALTKVTGTGKDGRERG